MLIDGKQLANEILEKLKLSIFNSQFSTPPTMAVILVGDNPASLSYIKQKQKSAELIGAKVILKQFPENVSKENFNFQLSTFNSDPSIHGIIVQRPLPPSLSHHEITSGSSVSNPQPVTRNSLTNKQSDKSAISNKQFSNWLDLAITPSKDIDGFNPQSKFLSPVGLAVLHALNYCYSISNKQKATSNKKEDTNEDNFQLSTFNFQFPEWLSSQNILLLGRGETGGKPIANIMDKLKIKYTQTYSRGVMHYAPTQAHVDQTELLKQSDIIISAIGIPNLITGDMIKKGAICIGVGIARQPTKKQNNEIQMSEDGSQKLAAVLTGDFEESTISTKASFYTPTPGGIGPLTVAFLLDNLLKSWENKN